MSPAPVEREVVDARARPDAGRRGHTVRCRKSTAASIGELAPRGISHAGSRADHIAFPRVEARSCAEWTVISHHRTVPISPGNRRRLSPSSDTVACNRARRHWQIVLVVGKVVRNARLDAPILWRLQDIHVAGRITSSHTSICMMCGSIGLQTSRASTCLMAHLASLHLRRDGAEGGHDRKAT